MRITPYDESIGCIKSCYDDFEKFAERTQYDKKFMEYLRKNSYSLEMSYGEYIIFDSRCLHCTQYNDTNETRISMDIRIIRESEIESYSRSYITTGRKKMPFLPGHYFSNLAV